MAEADVGVASRLAALTESLGQHKGSLEAERRKLAIAQAIAQLEGDHSGAIKALEGFLKKSDNGGSRSHQPPPSSDEKALMLEFALVLIELGTEGTLALMRLCHQDRSRLKGVVDMNEVGKAIAAKPDHVEALLSSDSSSTRRQNLRTLSGVACAEFSALIPVLLNILGPAFAEKPQRKAQTTPASAVDADDADDAEEAEEVRAKVVEDPELITDVLPILTACGIDHERGLGLFNRCKDVAHNDLFVAAYRMLAALAGCEARQAHELTAVLEWSTRSESESSADAKFPPAVVDVAWAWFRQHPDHGEEALTAMMRCDFSRFRSGDGKLETILLIASAHPQADGVAVVVSRLAACYDNGVGRRTTSGPKLEPAILLNLVFTLGDPEGKLSDPVADVMNKAGEDKNDALFERALACLQGEDDPAPPGDADGEESGNGGAK